NGDLQSTLAGDRGNLGQKVSELPGIWSLDATVSKAFRISETKRLQLRLDATNLFNHPEPADPNLNINNNDVPLGNIDMKTGVRQSQLGIRLELCGETKTRLEISVHLNDVSAAEPIKQVSPGATPGYL